MNKKAKEQTTTATEEILQPITVEENEKLSQEQRETERSSAKQKKKTSQNGLKNEDMEQGGYITPPKNSEISELQEIEQQLAILGRAGHRNWTQQFMLMQRVEEGELFKPEFNKFTAWLQAFAQKYKIAESELWRTKKAGCCYAKFFARQTAAGKTPLLLEQSHLAPESLVLIEKIAQKDETLADKYIQGTISGKYTRKDLWAKYASMRAHRQRSGTDGNATQQNEATAHAASDLIMALTTTGAAWIPQALYEFESEKTVFGKPKYRLFPEFPVRTGTTDSARHMDALIVEDFTIGMHQRLFDLHFHAIEIKVNKYDLINDRKMGEYSDFANFSWLVVPAELAELAASEEVLRPGWGLLAVEFDPDNNPKITVVKVAEKSEIANPQSLYTALAKSL